MIVWGCVGFVLNFAAVILLGNATIRICKVLDGFNDRIRVLEEAVEDIGKDCK